jgi:hypothetical protein
MTEKPKGPIVPWLADRLGEPRESLLGAADIAVRLGVTRQRVAQLRQDDPAFPRAFSGYGHAKVWRTSGIECWAAGHRRKRPEAGGRFVGEAGDLLLAVEGHAARLNVAWIDSMLFWLAIASGDAGPGLKAALLSMGITSDGIEELVRGWRGTDDSPKRTRRMNPHLQSFLAAADRRVADEGRAAVRPLDILLAFIDAEWERYAEMRKPQPTDHLLAALDRRGLDIDELRRRMVAADADPAAASSFEQRRLRGLPGRTSTKPKLDLAPNPLGHDPWTRFPWGAAFARTREGQHLKVDGEVWFFTIDGDGFYIRAPDGRPIGYRYRMPPRIRKGQRVINPINGFMEILPMPPVEMADWPDHQFSNDD